MEVTVPRAPPSKDQAAGGGGQRQEGSVGQACVPLPCTEAKVGRCGHTLSFVWGWAQAGVQGRPRGPLARE